MSDHNRERETTTIVTTDGGDRGSGGTLIAVVLLIAVLGLLFYLFGDRLMGGGESKEIKVDIQAPATGGSGS